MMFIALILALPVISLQHAVSPEEEVRMNDLAKAYRQIYETAPEAFKLADNIYEQIKDYECARNQEDCKAWQAWRLGDAITLRQVNCDETPEDELCMKARDLHGLPRGTSHQEIFSGLVDVAEGVTPTDIKYASDVIDAAVSYVCYKQPEKCSIVRYVH